MPYKPNFCCQCGEKIERVNWRFWHSRRFCQVCETDFIIQDWLPQITGIGLLLAVFGISAYFQKPEKTLNVTPNQFVSSVSGNKIPANQNTAVRLPNENSVQTAESSKANPLPQQSPAELKKPETKAGQTESKKTELSEKVYFCGAETKKGTPCSRRVRGGGRCWQHEGQTAMLKQEELVAGQ